MSANLRPPLWNCLPHALLLGLTLLSVTAARAQRPDPIVPDPSLTPGATLPVTVQDIAVPGYTSKVRNVPQSVKNKVYAEYGITSHRAGHYEIDHLISLELGGSNSIRNLWPQSYLTQPYNAHVKDRLENKLHELVVSGQVPLATAQQEIATDWIGAYRKYVGVDLPPLGASSSGGGPLSGILGRLRRRRAGPSAAAGAGATADAASAAPADAGDGQVWVNTKSGKFFRPGSRYYGKTKQGQYMSEQAAVQQGYTAASGQ